MYVAKIKSPNIMGAYSKGQDIKAKRIKNELAEEKQKQIKAEEEMYGNYLTKNSPENAVQPTDENGNGTIDPEEEQNALRATGRKYGAFNKIRSDTEKSDNRKDIMATRAAARGRAIRAEKRAIEKHAAYMEKVAGQEADEERYFEAKSAQLKAKGLSDEQVNLIISGERAGAIKDGKEYSNLSFPDRMIGTQGIDKMQNQLYQINKAYSQGANPNAKLTDEQRAQSDGQSVEAVNEWLKELEGVALDQANKGEKEKVQKIKVFQDKLRNIIKGGKFNYQASQDLTADLARKQNQFKVINEGKELEAEQKLKKEKSTGKERDIAEIERIDATPRKDRTRVEQRRLDKFLGKKKASDAGIVKIIEGQFKNVGEWDKEALDKRSAIKLKAIGLRKKYAKANTEKSNEEIVLEARNIVEGRTKGADKKKPVVKKKYNFPDGTVKYDKNSKKCFEFTGGYPSEVPCNKKG